MKIQSLLFSTALRFALAFVYSTIEAKRRKKNESESAILWEMKYKFTGFTRMCVCVSVCVDEIFCIHRMVCNRSIHGCIETNTEFGIIAKANVHIFFLLVVRLFVVYIGRFVHVIWIRNAFISVSFQFFVVVVSFLNERKQMHVSMTCACAMCTNGANRMWRIICVCIKLDRW